MKRILAILAVALGWVGASAGAGQAPAGNYVERYDTIYNSLTIERRADIVELRARARGNEALESAVDLSNPLRLVVPYTRTLYAGLFLQPEPKRVLMIGLGGAGFHRPFAEVFPEALLQPVELDPKVFELCQTHMGFKPTEKTPVALMDGRMFVKRNRDKWDWIILDAFRGGFVPPHLKTEEFYRECAARMGERGVFVTNLHATSQLYYSDLKTIQKVFPQMLLFETPGRGNVIAVAVKYRTPSIADESTWASADELTKKMRGLVDMERIRRERADVPQRVVDRADVLTDDFAPVEFLDALKTNNSDGL